MKPPRLVGFIRSIPLHLVIILLCLVWIVPTIGLLVTSFRPVQAINTSGWWTVVSGPPGSAE
jgi:alpha-glucoside transport system permease protein